MTIFNHTISREGLNDFKGYLSLPVTGKGPGIVLLHEVYGINDSLKATADRYAQMGFVVLCPNLYWRMNPNASYRPQNAGEPMSKELENDRLESYILMDRLDNALVCGDIQMAINNLRSHSSCTGKVGLIGLCLGGRCALLAASQTDADSAIAFYPTRYHDDLKATANQIKIPFLFIIPMQDPYVSDDEKNLALASAEKSYIHVINHGLRYNNKSYGPTATGSGNPFITTHIFPNQDHAFSRINGVNYQSDPDNKATSIIANHFASSLGYQPSALELHTAAAVPQPAHKNPDSKCDKPEWC